jgi:hypothetical protein
VPGALRAEMRRGLRALWTRIIHSGASLRVNEPSRTDGFERFMSEFEAHNRIQQHPPKERIARHS